VLNSKDSMKNIIKKWWFWPLIVGLVIRAILMPITLHPDLWGHSFVAYFFAYQGKLNIYEHLASLPLTHPLVRNFGVSDIFIYPPLTYFTLGFFRLLVKPFTDPAFIPWLMENLGEVHSYRSLFWHLFLFKFPYLFFDLGLAFLLAGLFNDEKKKKLAFALWILNPVTLYATFMVGQLDVLPTFFSVLSLYFAQRKKKSFAMISLGIGGSYKMYPLLFIPLAAFILGDNFKNRVKFILLGIFPYLLMVAPYLTSPAFRSMVLFSPKSQKMLFMNWKMTGAEGIYPFVLGLSLLYFYSYYVRKKMGLDKYFLATTLLIFSLTHYHPQWFLWVSPFLIIELVDNNFRYLFLVATLLFSWLIITFLFEPSLSLALFNPINPGLNKAIGISEILSKYIDVFQFKSIIRSLFAGCSIYYLYSLFGDKAKLKK